MSKKILKKLQRTESYKKLARRFKPEIDVREATEDDLVRFSRYLFAKPDLARGKIEDFRLHIVAVTLKNKYVGSVMLQNYHMGKISYEYCILYNMKVKYMYRRMGIGSMLTGTFIKSASNRGYKEIFLTTGINNIAAIKLYEKKGFIAQPTDKLRDEYKNELEEYYKPMVPMVLKIK